MYSSKLIFPSPSLSRYSKADWKIILSRNTLYNYMHEYALYALSLQICWCDRPSGHNVNPLQSCSSIASIHSTFPMLHNIGLYNIYPQKISK